MGYATNQTVVIPTEARSAKWRDLRLRPSPPQISALPKCPLQNDVILSAACRATWQAQSKNLLVNALATPLSARRKYPLRIRPTPSPEHSF